MRARLEGDHNYETLCLLVCSLVHHLTTTVHWPHPSQMPLQQTWVSEWASMQDPVVKYYCASRIFIYVQPC